MLDVIPSRGLMDTPVFLLVLLGVPLLMIGLVSLFAFQLTAQEDPDSLFEGENTERADVPMKVAIGSAVLAMIGGFFFALAFVGKVSLGWLFVAWIFWAPVVRVLHRSKRKPRPPVSEDDDVPLKRAIPDLVAIAAAAALYGAWAGGAISANAFFAGIAVFIAVRVLLNRRSRR
ncbi:MAG: hypothetical protein WBN10_05425 [Polyangiales bacterium]